MAYNPISIKGTTPGNSTTSFMAKKGMNIRDLPQLLSPEFALIIRNYIVTTDGGLRKRNGLEPFFDQGGTDPILMLEKYTDDIYIFAFATTVAAYTISTDTITSIKTDFNVSGFSGARYGDYFFVASPGDNIGRISQTLDYNNQTANFTVGEVVTGGTSGATAIILEDSDAGVTGTLTLGSIQGTFQTTELITDPLGGSADANGVVGFTFTSISGAPKAKVIKVVDTRLFAGNLEVDPTRLTYSEVDDGSNPPFDSWPSSTTAADGGSINYRNAGPINAISNLAAVIVVFADDGKWGFTIETIDSGGTLKKIDQTQIFQIDAGGARTTLQNEDGLFYANEEGLWQLVGVGQQDIAFSRQEAITSVLLGSRFFDNIDFSEADMVYSSKEKVIYLSVKRDSDKNNYIIGYNTEFKAFFTITGWNVNRWLKDDDIIYAGSANDETKVWEAFNGFDDDGTDIWTEFYQELTVAPLENRQAILGQYVQGFLSPSTELDLRFDIYDRTGKFIKDKMKLRWTSNNDPGLSDGYGIADWGKSPWGGDVDLAGTVESFAGFRGRINNWQRIRLRITGNDKVAHQINWFSLQTKSKVPIRRRNLVQIS